MKIIINSSSMVPIYEQIVDQVKAQIISGELKEDDNLPSVRTLSKELRISALTVKKAYDSGTGRIYGYHTRKGHLCGCRQQRDDDGRVSPGGGRRADRGDTQSKKIRPVGRGYPGDAGADIGGIAYAEVRTGKEAV